MSTRTISKQRLLRHLAVAIFAGILFYLFYLSRSDVSFVHRLWRATGDTGFVLLFITLLIGPLSKLWKSTIVLYPWRRQFGVWFGIVAIIHSILILDGWIEWSLQKFLGFEFVPQLGKQVLLLPGFGLANILGTVALFWVIVLMATSSDTALSYLGGSAWKYLHGFGNVIFYLGGLHAIYFVFFHYNQVVYEGRNIPPNWFRYHILVMVITLFMIQLAGFLKVTLERKRSLSG